MVFGPRLRIGPSLEDGRVEVELGGAHLRALVGELAGFGGAVEIVDPPEARELLRTIGEELASVYAAS
jgi:predicted DNA-binding transcriptional regulator YafY